MSRAHRPRAGFWIRLSVIIVYPLCDVFFKLRWLRIDRIPATGPVIIVVNHISQADTIAMARMIWQSGRIPRFLIKSGVFDLPGIGRLMHGAKQIPVYRGSADAARSLNLATEYLGQGEAIVIYPEGTITRDPDYWPMRAKSGVARLILDNPGVPVIPIGQWGAHRTLGRAGKFRPFPRQRHAALVGEPIDLAKFRDRDPSMDVLRELTELVMFSITEQVAVLREESPPLKRTRRA